MALRMPEIKAEFWLPGSMGRPKGEYWFETLWCDQWDKSRKDENAISILSQLVRNVPMGSYFKIIYVCPFTETETEFNADRKRVVKQLERLRDSILEDSPMF